MVLNIFIGFVIVYAISFLIFMGIYQYIDERNSNIMSKYPEYKELFKIKAFKKAFLKKYKLLKSKEYYVGLIESMNKDIDILDVEMSIYKKSYKNYNNGYRRFEHE